MTTALAIRNDMSLSEVGNVLARSGFFADSKDAAQAVVKVLAGAELGLGPVASMTGIYIVKGRVTLSANLIAGAIKRSGRYNFKVTEHSDKACSIDFYEGGEKCGNSTFTIEDARRAQLGGDNWTKYPRNMLYARAMSNGAKWYCPDVFAGGIYTPDELGEVVDGETGEVVQVEEHKPAPKPVVSGSEDKPKAAPRNPPAFAEPPANMHPSITPALRGRWDSLTAEARALNIEMNYTIGEDDTADTLKERAKYIKAEIIKAADATKGN